MKAKESRNKVLYVRVKKSNKDWVTSEAKRLNFRSKSEFMDATLDEVRIRNDRKS